MTTQPYAIGDPIRFATTAATVANGVCYRHGTVQAVHLDHPDGVPRYDIALTFDNVIWQRVAPIHLMKDPIDVVSVANSESRNNQ